MDTVKKLSEENKILMKYKTNAMLVNEDEIASYRDYNREYKDHRDLKGSQMSNSQHKFYQSDNIDTLMDSLNANNYKEDLSVCSNSSTKVIEKRIMDYKNKLKEATYGRRSPELYKSNTKRVKEIHEYSPRSNQFHLSSRFFNQCKMILNKSDYDTLIDLITNERDDLHERVNELLTGHPGLISDFRILFKY
jgi:GTP1/Obg family GTP-binding protein